MASAVTTQSPSTTTSRQQPTNQLKDLTGCIRGIALPAIHAIATITPRHVDSPTTELLFNTLEDRNNFCNKFVDKNDVTDIFAIGGKYSAKVSTSDPKKVAVLWTNLQEDNDPNDLIDALRTLRE